MEVESASETTFFFKFKRDKFQKKDSVSVSNKAEDFQALLERLPFVYSDQELCMACHA